MHSVIQTVKYLFTYYLLLLDCGCQKLRKLRTYILPSVSHCFAAHICRRFFMVVPRSPALLTRGDSVITAINRHLSQNLHILHRGVTCSVYSSFFSCNFQKKEKEYVKKEKSYQDVRLILSIVPSQIISIPFLARNFLYNPK